LSSRRARSCARFSGHNDKIFCIRWNTHDNNQFVTVGVKHIKFWTQAGGGITAKQGVFGKIGGKQGKQKCVAFGKNVDSCITGGGDGCVYLWTKTMLTRRVDGAHVGPLFALTAVQDKVRTRPTNEQSGTRSFARGA
jgi:WD40 repeat protein